MKSQVSIWWLTKSCLPAFILNLQLDKKMCILYLYLYLYCCTAQRTSLQQLYHLTNDKKTGAGVSLSLGCNTELIAVYT